MSTAECGHEPLHAPSLSLPATGNSKRRISVAGKVSDANWFGVRLMTVISFSIRK